MRIFPEAAAIAAPTLQLPCLAGTEMLKREPITEATVYYAL